MTMNARDVYRAIRPLAWNGRGSTTRVVILVGGRELEIADVEIVAEQGQRRPRDVRIRLVAEPGS